MTTPVRWVLLHGFAGSPASWDDTLAVLRPELPPIVPALCGHRDAGGAVVPGESCFLDEVRRLAAIVAEHRREGERRGLAGYSLGGRLALRLAIQRPDLFDAVVPISAHPGLEDESEREERVAADEDWASLLEREGIETFVEAWESHPVFAGQENVSAELLERQRRTRLGQDPRSLASAMRALSLGAMPGTRAELPRVELPAFFIAGERDRRFRALAADAAARMSTARVVTLAGCGHNPLLEAPQALADELRRIASELGSGRLRSAREDPSSAGDLP